VVGNQDNAVTLLIEPELEAEAFKFGFQVASGNRVDSGPHCSAVLNATDSVVVQPVIVNVGEDALYAEFRKYNGWIVAKDVYIAFFEGGAGQATFELSDNVTNTKLGDSENIYLQGHGSPGKVGHYPAHDVANFIVKFTFPEFWLGKIRAYCCSAGLGSALNDSGVAELAAALAIKKNIILLTVEVTGAAGVALNCRSYPNGTRVFKNDAAAGKRIDDAIKRTRGPVDAEWKKWVEVNIPPFIPGDQIPGGLSPLSKNVLWAAAYKASAISKSFYEDLQRSCGNDLIESGKDLTTKKVLW
jgi:hypothetical protein